MANFAHFQRRSYELKHKEEILTELNREVDLFIRKTDKYTINGAAIELDSKKQEEIINDLLKAERLIDEYINQIHKASRFKVRHWEQDMMRGAKSDLVGLRRKIIGKLKLLQRRVNLFRKTVSTFKMTDRGKVFEQTVQQVDNYIDVNDGNIQIGAGGEIIVTVTLLLAFLAELLKRKNTELE